MSLKFSAFIFSICLFPSGRISAQQAGTLAGNVAAANEAQASTMPKVSGLQGAGDGLNAGITFAGVHDSRLGWFTSLTPALDYRVSEHFSADVSASLFPTRNALNPDPTPPLGSGLEATRWDASDTFLAGHFQFSRARFLNTVTTTVTFPSGSKNDGLSTGRVTYDASMHTERYFKNLGAILDVGGGDSSSVSNGAVTKDYDTLGSVIHFQAGLIYWFPRRTYLQSIAYEQLPLGDQTVYTTVGFPNGDGPSKTVVSGKHAYEDNGFTTSFGTPLSEHVTLTSYYNRSLRLHLDTVSIGLSFVWKGTPIQHRQSIDDKAFLEGERLLAQQPAKAAAPAQ